MTEIKNNLRLIFIRANLFSFIENKMLGWHHCTIIRKRMDGHYIGLRAVRLC